jgi:DNA modification methylase
MDGIKQNSQLTFKYNKSFGRHGWLRLTPAYSVKMVEQILSELDYLPECVFEPFSGTGTTELVCANRNIPAIAYDINPFLVWFANAKCSVYSTDVIEHFLASAKDIITAVSGISPCDYPPMYNIERWWHSRQLNYLARIKAAIWKEKNNQLFDLLKIVFCRLVIALSNVAFNHVSTSFDDSKDNCEFTDNDGNNLFLSICEMIANTISEQPKAHVIIENKDSRYIPAEMTGKFDTLITSPPYPNRISYIRELRPYMYWLDYINTPDDASDLDWRTIGGTWGSATSKLSMWEKKTDLLPDYLFDIAESISAADNKSAGLMANYVLKYFDDIAMHMKAAYDTIKDGGTVHYIVGNSNFYGNTVPSDEIYKSILSTVGFTNEKSVVVRKRNCNKALYEYWISAKK